MRFPDRVRYLNKRYLNRLTLRLARSTWGPFAVVYHVGRRSGRPYQTPIIAIPAPDGFVVALTYGPEVDWYRNVLAAGGCRIGRHGRETLIAGVEPLAVQAALPYFPWMERTVLRLAGTQDFVRLRKQE
ncbi:MAG: nitroreductase family deazaflavin-dependent oxidoreductase [Anaerolineaceae bacterium]|nr:nitroreductase family deazaflavin-dependent oxidoreductase [Anaerolineaceae bacterium]